MVDNIAAPGAASWRIEIITADLAGYEIDNVSFTLAVNPLCDLELNQAVYTAGDMIIANVARLANPTPNPAASNHDNLVLPTALKQPASS